MSLPLFTFLDKSLQQLQTQWSSVLNPVIAAFNLFNTKPPTQHNLKSSGIYTTPSNVFYLNIRMCATSGATTFGPSFLSATSSGAVIPNNPNVQGVYLAANNYLDVIISNPQASYPYALASSGYLLVREFYQ